MNVLESFSLKGRVALVTGAGDPQGYGAQCAIALWEAGATVYIAARSDDRMKAFCANYPGMRWKHLDMSVESEIKAIVPAIVGGDMNTTILDTALLAFDDAHLSPACAQPASQLCHHITYNAFGKGPGSAIDHFFVRAVNLKDYRILDGNYGAPYLSDHFPVQIVFSLLPQ